jgi:hypothetical protein
MRPWCLTCGQDVAHQLRRQRPRPGDTWHLAEVFRTINGARHDLWRAVEQDGTGRDSLVQPRRHKKAATQCIRTLLNGCHDVPRVRVTDQLKRDGAGRGLHPRVTPSAASRSMVPSPHTSARAVTSSLPLNTVKRWGKEAIPGRKSRAFPPPHKTDAPGSRVPPCSLILSIGNKLTTPLR